VMSPETLIAAFPARHELLLSVVGVALRVRTNDPDVFAGLRVYFGPYVVPEAAGPVADVRVIQGDVKPAGAFVDLQRADGRKVKEAVQELPGGRLVWKHATGVVMGLWSGGAFAVGDVRTNLNQAINLVNSCYAKAILRRGYLLLHASAVSREGRAVLLAGPPGAGKSTGALHLVEAGFRFVSNDRVLAKPVGEFVEALGYPKQPRVNPGTLLHHPRLSALLKPEDRSALAALPQDQLWALERKSDVDLEAIYGKGTVELRSRLLAVVLLKWRRDGEGFAVRRVTTADALADLPLFAKTLGAFDLDRPPHAPITSAERARYGELLDRVRLVEVVGRVDFAALVTLAGDLLPG